MKRIEEGMVIELNNDLLIDWNNPHKTKGFPVWANAFLVGYVPYYQCSWFNPIVTAIRNKDVRVRETNQIVLIDQAEMEWSIKVLWTPFEEFVDLNSHIQQQILSSFANKTKKKFNIMEEDIDWDSKFNI